MELLVALTFASGVLLYYCVSDGVKAEIGRWILDTARQHLPRRLRHWLGIYTHDELTAIAAGREFAKGLRDAGFFD